MVDFDPSIYPTPPSYGGHEWKRDTTGAYVCKHCEWSAYGESKPCTAHHWLPNDNGDHECARCKIRDSQQGSKAPCSGRPDFPRISPPAELAHEWELPRNIALDRSGVPVMVKICKVCKEVKSLSNQIGICPGPKAREGGPVPIATALKESPVLRSIALAPIPLLLWCPECGERHIDFGVFVTKGHHTHACQACGMTWRPAVQHTVGVRFLPGFKDDEPVETLQ